MLISDCFDFDGFEPGLEVLRHGRFETQVWHVVDAKDAEIRDAGDITAIDCETGNEVAATVTDVFRERLRSAHQRFLSDLERYCYANGVVYSRCDVEVPFERIVLEASRARGRFGT